MAEDEPAGATKLQAARDKLRLCTRKLTAGAPVDSHGMLSMDLISAGRKAAASRREPVHERGPREEDLMSPTTKEREGGVDLVWFKKKVEFEMQHSIQNKDNYLDFYRKYEESPSEPQTDLGDVKFSWAIVFSLPDMKEEKWAKRAGGDGEMQLVHPECWTLVQRMWAADLSIAMEPSSDGKEVHVSVGAAYEVLVDEANVVKPRMRMINCKGTSLFDSAMISNYMPSLFDEAEKATCFTSGHAQALVMNRMKRIAGIDLEERARSVTREKAMELVKRDLSQKRAISCRRLRELLAAHGAFRSNAGKILGEEVDRLRDQAVADPFFRVEPEHELTKHELAILHAEEEHMAKLGLEVPKYEDVEKVVEILEEYTSKEPGLSEEFVGSVKIFFPLHNEDELDFLRHAWGSYQLMFQPWCYGKSPEGPNTENYFRASMDDRHVSAFYGPLDTIRDYFGEHVGLYQAWLALYTKYLCFPAFIGMVIQMYQIVAPEVDSTNNWLMVPYSVFLCLWSAQFNSSWKRRENELKFLWGSDLVEEQEPVRPDFKGVLVIDPVTKGEEIEYFSACARATRIILSTLISIAIVLLVIFLAFSATTVRFYQSPDPSEVYCAEQITYQGPLVVNGTQQNVTANGTDTGAPIIVDITEYIRVDNIFNKADCQALATKQTIDVFGVMDGISVVHHVDDDDVIHTTWVDGWPEGTTNFDKNKWGWLSALLNTVMIIIFGTIYEACAVSLTDWENHRTETEYMDQLILKNFGFQFVNNYFVLFYIGYMRQIDTSSFGGPPVEVTECRSGTCLGQLQTQIVVVFTTKTMIAQVIEIFKPRLKAKAAEAKRLLRIRELRNTMADVANSAATVTMDRETREMMGLDKDSIAHERAQRSKQQELEMRFAAAVADDSQSAVERESFLMEYESTFDDFNEMAIQFGYCEWWHSSAELDMYVHLFDQCFLCLVAPVALFSPVYPFAAFLALLNNLLEIRVDASKLCYTMRRPVWTAAEDIGSWYTVMNVLGFAAVITNSTMITFVGKLLAETEEAALGGLKARTKEWNLWLIAVMVEHSVLIGRVLILTEMKPGREILEELELHKQYKSKYDVSDEDVHPEVERTLLTQNSIRAHMESRGIGPEQRKAQREERRQKALAGFNQADRPGQSKTTQSSTALKIVNPMQQDLADTEDD